MIRREEYQLNVILLLPNTAVIGTQKQLFLLNAMITHTRGFASACSTCHMVMYVYLYTQYELYKY